EGRPAGGGPTAPSARPVLRLRGASGAGDAGVDLGAAVLIAPTRALTVGAVLADLRAWSANAPDGRLEAQPEGGPAVGVVAWRARDVAAEAAVLLDLAASPAARAATWGVGPTPRRLHLRRPGFGALEADVEQVLGADGARAPDGVAPTWLRCRFAPGAAAGPLFDGPESDALRGFAAGPERPGLAAGVGILVAAAAAADELPAVRFR
ncbi:MAG TPA: hypothetical protein VEI02_03350, partial [Planctomycetota bacterium]|nr:hypothetical protein [Planctomycetota bacterium]